MIFHFRFTVVKGYSVRYYILDIEFYVMLCCFLTFIKILSVVMWFRSHHLPSIQAKVFYLLSRSADVALLSPPQIRLAVKCSNLVHVYVDIHSKEAFPLQFGLLIHIQTDFYAFCKKTNKQKTTPSRMKNFRKRCFTVCVFTWRQSCFVAPSLLFDIIFCEHHLTVWPYLLSSSA